MKKEKDKMRCKNCEQEMISFPSIINFCEKCLKGDLREPYERYRNIATNQCLKVNKTIDVDIVDVEVNKMLELYVKEFQLGDFIEDAEEDESLFIEEDE